MSKEAFIHRRIGQLLQLGVWCMLFLSPLTFLRHQEEFTLTHYLMVAVSPLALLVVFYLNYFWLVPGLYFKNRIQTYRTVNILIVVGMGLVVHYWQSYSHSVFNSPAHPHHELTFMEDVLFAVRDIFGMAVTVAIANAIRMGERWHHSEEARFEAEAARAEAELRNLRSQINPHFLLNTLNNIYALTAFDQKRAQTAIQQLSKMLRHILYDNQQEEVLLSDEILFLENYVSLMKIRLPQTVDVKFSGKVSNPDIRIAPLMFISLVENAFKHGVSTTEPSFIHISISTDIEREGVRDLVVCSIENSNYPKTQQDRSGHGIGLSQVQRRLDLAYPNSYEWKKGVSADGKTYYSNIKIKV